MTASASSHEVIEHHGQLDILVNNAGITVDKPVWKLSPADWDKVLQVDLSGAFYMSKPAIEHMIGRGSGRIINISSVTGEMGNVGQANYAASKSGLFGLTKTLAREAALALRVAGTLEKGIGVTVNCITPGLIETDMVVTIPPYMVAEIVERIPVHRMGQPGGNRARRVLPRPGCLGLHHRADLGRRRRTQHVIGLDAPLINELRKRGLAMATHVSEKEARDVVEAAREADWKLPSFGKQLFLGDFRLDLIHPQPQLDPEAVEKGERFLASCARLLEAEVDPLEIERDAKIPDRVVDGLKKIGALGMKVDPEYGGLGLSQLYYSRALAIAGVYHSSLCTLLSAHQSIGVAEPLRMFGSEEQKRKWLPLVAKDHISAFSADRA